MNSNCCKKNSYCRPEAVIVIIVVVVVVVVVVEFVVSHGSQAPNTTNEHSSGWRSGVRACGVYVCLSVHC